MKIARFTLPLLLIGRCRARRPDPPISAMRASTTTAASSRRTRPPAADSTMRPVDSMPAPGRPTSATGSRSMATSVTPANSAESISASAIPATSTRVTLMTPIRKLTSAPDSVLYRSISPLASTTTSTAPLRTTPITPSRWPASPACTGPWPVFRRTSKVSISSSVTVRRLPTLISGSP